MQLNSQQKNYIKKNVRKISLGEIAQNLNLSQSDILNYLKKKWRKEKYQNYLKQVNQSRNEKKLKKVKNKNFFRENRKIFFLLTGLVLIVYLNSVRNGFVSDDIGAIVKNENIGNFSFIWKSIFGSLLAFTRFIIFHLFELAPAPYRLFNILLHIGSVLLIFSILNIFHKKSVAFFTALLFAVHPFLVESVTWISGAPYVLYSFLFLLSFYFYLMADGNKKYYYLSIILFFLACITSEKAIPLFLVFVFYEWIFKNNKNFWKIVTPFFIVALILGTTFASGFGQRVTELETSYYQENENKISPLTQVPVAVSHYLGLLIWPSGLTLYHTEMSFSNGVYFLMTLLSLIVLTAVFYSLKKNKQVFFWLVFFFIALSATLTPLGVAWIVAERYAYLASLGIFVIVALGLDWFYEKLKTKGKSFEKIFYILLAIIIILLGIRTIIRNNDWKNEDTLWIATARVAPSGQTIHNNLGDVYGRQGDYQKAIEEFKKAIEVNPHYADAYHNLANTYQEIGQTDLAIENYQKALEFNPQLWQSYQNLASIYFNKDEYQKALENIQKALVIDPESENLKQNLEVIKNKIE